MELKLIRFLFTPKSTTGQLTIAGANECYILEDTYRQPGEAKVFGETAIPCGRYRLLKTFSPRFNRMAYLIEGVPGFAGIRIHGGNIAADTEGCLLTGRKIGHDRVDESLLALKALEAKLDAATDPIFLTIELKA